MISAFAASLTVRMRSLTRAVYPWSAVRYNQPIVHRDEDRASPDEWHDEIGSVKEVESGAPDRARHDELLGHRVGPHLDGNALERAGEKVETARRRKEHVLFLAAEPRESVSETADVRPDAEVEDLPAVDSDSHVRPASRRCQCSAIHS